MIPITKSPTADTRTCDYSKVTEQQLLLSSMQHIEDVQNAMAFFIRKMYVAARNHDKDKITDIKGFHADFLTGFKETAWWDAHRWQNRHHLEQEDGIPSDVNLLDILEYICDCTMAGKARSGTVRPLVMTPALLIKAFNNTAAMLDKEVVVV